MVGPIISLSLIDKYRRVSAFADLIEAKILLNVIDIKGYPHVIDCSVSYSYSSMFSICFNYENNRKKNVFRNLIFYLTIDKSWFLSFDRIEYKCNAFSFIRKMIDLLYSSDKKIKRKKDHSNQSWSTSYRKSRDPRFK